MMKCFVRIIRNDNGQGLVEYGLIILLVVLAVVLGLQAFGVTLSGYYEQITDSI